MTQHVGDAGWDEDDVPEWADQVMATVAAEVRRRRKELRMSAQDLADRCEEIGHPIPRNVIANMESGRRANLPLIDVLVLAEALQTPPLTLIYPVGYVPEVQRLPFRYTEPTWDALHWFTGDLDEHPYQLDTMLRRFHRHVGLQRAAFAAIRGEKHERWKAETASIPTKRAEAEQNREDYAERALQAKYELRSLRASIRKHGGTPPLLPPELHDVDPPEPDTVTEERL
ncbi:transcriptional regulator [Streptomyces sp. NWU339]|uniref:helix-turn-helix domain-containing protein n=1 Tax=Streptomyces sp. NWU339 TaxID=2185284 RepID=UPI000D673708|nr:helix-turn-helix transcriptional regulator [Streptomyces sp. NWU339]PWI12316.1 transcriptional regulator [Streptomyces sp. NWU339]